MTKKYIRADTANTNKTCYHTDKDCEQLKAYREVTKNEIAYHDLRLCKFCDPDASPRPNDEQDRSHLRALQKAAKND
jgi:hypothetical protein